MLRHDQSNLLLELGNVFVELSRLGNQCFHVERGWIDESSIIRQCVRITNPLDDAVDLVLVAVAVLLQKSAEGTRASSFEFLVTGPPLQPLQCSFAGYIAHQQV